MTLKNTNVFTVDVVNRQVNNGDTDYIKETGVGSLRVKDETFFVKYKTDNATVMLKLSCNRAKVTRMGESCSNMEYVLNKTTKFLYNTPYGSMDMELLTKRIDFDLDDTGGKIILKYDLCGIENNMEITLRRKS